MTFCTKLVIPLSHLSTKMLRTILLSLILLMKASGFTVSFSNLIAANSTAVPILDNTGEPISVGSGYVAAGMFEALPGSIDEVRSFIPFGEGSSVFSNPFDTDGFFDGSRSAPIPAGTVDAPVGRSVFLVLGNGADLMDSTDFAIFDTGLIFDTEDAVGFGALDINLTSDTLDEDSLIYGTILTDVDTGVGVSFEQGIKLGFSETLGDLTYTKFNGNITITDCNEGAGGALIIPDFIEGYPVVGIGDDAFASCGSLTSVTIPDSVTSIGFHAFSGCTSLATVKIPAGVTNIRSGAFLDCLGLTSVTIPEGVTDIGIRAFYNCQRLASITIPNSVTTIEDNAFAFCKVIKNVTIPQSVTFLGRGVFIRCADLVNITVHVRNPNYSSLDGVLFTKSQDTLLFFPSGREGEYRVPDGVASITSYAFDSCLLSEVIIPSSVTALGEKAFQLSSQLASVILGEGLTAIGQEIFGNCTNLTNMVIPGNITSIGSRAFVGCSNLLEVIFEGPAPDVQSEAFTSIADEAIAFVKTEHTQSYGGDGASWEAFTIREISTPPVLNLESFYESAPNEVLEINASNFPLNYSGTTFQWFFNGFPIPENFGGKSPEIKFDGLASSNGTWSVTATNFLGEATATFEYRVFVDTDSDGLSDYREQNLIGTDFELADTDGDGLTDKFEYEGATDPKIADTDQDGLSDSVEINQTQTDPIIADTDQNGILDGLDDKDGDGLSNKSEVEVHGTSPLLADTDGDSIKDGTEVEISSDPKVATSTGGLIEIIRGLKMAQGSDGDGDGLTDVKETELGSDAATETTFYLADAYDEAVNSAVISGRSEVISNPQNFNLIPTVAYDALRVQCDANLASYRETLSEKDDVIKTLNQSITAKDEAYAFVVAERDARPTIEELKDARLGSVVLQPDAVNNAVKIRFSIEETDDFRTWTRRDEISEVSVPLINGKKFYRFALEDE
ncbi:leucine-rich repeat protein [Akkermansiaceae bacterium]|nr:leucine-rich repeat protein [Akkermansiaceae bacterium]